MSGVEVTATALAGSDLAVDRALSDIATSFRFLLDVTPVDLVARPAGRSGTPVARRRSSTARSATIRA